MAGGGEGVATLVCREASEGLPNGAPQIGDGAGRRGPEQSLQLGEDLLDRIEVRAVGRKVEQLGPDRLDGLGHARHLVGLQVVEDDGVARSEHGHERVVDVGSEACAVGGSVAQGGGTQAITAQGGADGGGLVLMGWTPPDGIDVLEPFPLT